MTVPARHGITFPFDGIPLLDQREIVRELVDLGYTDLWSAESGGYDAFTPLVVAAQWAPELRLGTAIVPVYTRGAHTLASTVASIDAMPLRRQSSITAWETQQVKEMYLSAESETARWKVESCLVAERVSADAPLGVPLPDLLLLLDKPPQ